jgi:predicted SnoaL-like aldol condensation-catalyzing enzyme
LVGATASHKRGGKFLSRFSLYRERLEVGRALVEINSTNWQSLLPYYSDDYEYHDPIVDIYGFDTLVPFFGRLFANSPDLVTTVEDEMLMGDVYTATWTMVGQFTGVPYSAKGMSILKFREGSTQTYYSRDYYSESDIMATVPGLDEAVVGFRIFYKCVVDPAFECPIPPPEP